MSSAARWPAAMASSRASADDAASASMGTPGDREHRPRSCAVPKARSSSQRADGADNAPHSGGEDVPIHSSFRPCHPVEAGGAAGGSRDTRLGGYHGVQGKTKRDD